MYLEFRWTFSCCCLSVVWSLPLGECHTRSWPVSSSVWYWPCWHVQDRSKLWPHEQELQPTCKAKLTQWNFIALSLIFHVQVHVPYILPEQIYLYIQPIAKKIACLKNFYKWQKKIYAKARKNEIIFTNLINPHVRVRWNDSSSREINSLSRQVSTETTLFTFQPLHKPSCHFLWLKWKFVYSCMCWSICTSIISWFVWQFCFIINLCSSPNLNIMQNTEYNFKIKHTMCKQKLFV